MATFDFVESAAGGYKFLWRERASVLRLAVPVIIIKFASFALITGFGLEQNFLRQGLVMLPAYFAEGWLLAYMIRIAIFGERLSPPVTGDRERDGDLLKSRTRGLMAGIVIYVLIKLMNSFLAGIIMLAEVGGTQQTPAPSFHTFAFGMAALAFMVWAFRLVWLYIPAAMNYPLTGFLYKIRGYITSIYMIGTWLICFVPPAMALVLFSELLLGIFPPTGGEPSALYRFILTGFQAVIEVVIAVVGTIGMAYGIRDMLYGEPDKNKFQD